MDEKEEIDASLIADTVETKETTENVEDAIYEVASSRYMQKKQAALISAGLKELGELQNG